MKIIGKQGFIGSYLDRYLPFGNDDDVIIYLGGLSGLQKCLDNQQDVHQKNVIDICQLARTLRPDQLLIYPSTSALYDGNWEGRETDFINFDYLNIYARSMYNREVEISHIKNINTVCLRLGTVIGDSPVQRYDLLHMKMIKEAILDRRITVKNPNALRPVLWNYNLQDTIEKIIKKKEQFVGHHVFNVCSFNQTIGGIAKDISDIVNVPIIENGSDGLFGYGMNIDRLKKYKLYLANLPNKELIYYLYLRIKDRLCG